MTQAAQGGFMWTDHEGIWLGKFNLKKKSESFHVIPQLLKLREFGQVDHVIVGIKINIK